MIGRRSRDLASACRSAPWIKPRGSAEPGGAWHGFADSAALSRGHPTEEASTAQFGDLPAGATAASGLRRDSGFLPYAPHGNLARSHEGRETGRTRPPGAPPEDRRENKDFGICREFASLFLAFSRAPHPLWVRWSHTDGTDTTDAPQIANAHAAPRLRELRGLRVR